MTIKHTGGEVGLPGNKCVTKINEMPKVGVYFGKFLPPHRGHLNTILSAATTCQKLYVVVSDNKARTARICRESGIEPITAEMRLQWLSQELIDMPHIKVVSLDETDIPEYPNGWPLWAQLMQKAVNESIDVFYCGEHEYVENLNYYFPEAEVRLFDPDRTQFNISATMIRKEPYKYWDYILGPARPFFAKKILIAGSESCGKTTLTKSLAKLYHTSWSEEVGRYYAQRYLGGNESIFTNEDFGRIAAQQSEQDYNALRNANRVCFFDTDATITQYYSELYMHHHNKLVEMYVNPDKYDVVFLLSPDVEWVDDGQRLNGDQKRREDLHAKLKQMYIDRGFGDKIVEIHGDYNQRLKSVINHIENSLLK